MKIEINKDWTLDTVGLDPLSHKNCRYGNSPNYMKEVSRYHCGNYQCKFPITEKGLNKALFIINSLYNENSIKL